MKVIRNCEFQMKTTHDLLIHVAEYKDLLDIREEWKHKNDGRTDDKWKSCSCSNASGICVHDWINWVLPAKVAVSLHLDGTQHKQPLSSPPQHMWKPSSVIVLLFCRLHCNLASPSKFHTVASQELFVENPVLQYTDLPQGPLRNSSRDHGILHLVSCVLHKQYSAGYAAPSSGCSLNSWDYSSISICVLTLIWG